MTAAQERKVRSWAGYKQHTEPPGLAVPSTGDTAVWQDGGVHEEQQGEICSRNPTQSSTHLTHVYPVGTRSATAL